MLFNTAQVLTSLAEAITEDKRPSEESSQEAMRYLQEALELFQRCLVLQELRFTESQEQIARMTEGNESGAFEEKPINQEHKSENTNAPENGQSDSEQWAAVIEPVTKDTLVDTAVAQLEALATLCGLITYDRGSTLAWIEEYSADLLREKIAAYAEGTERKNEVALARAKLISTLAEVSYRSGRIDLETYKNELGGAFAEVYGLSNNSRGLCSQAEALIAFNSAAADVVSPDESGKSLSLRWQSLSTALDSLTAASKLPGAENLSRIHMARGDVEMYRWRLGGLPWNYNPSRKNERTLLNNAQTCYRGSAAIALQHGAIDAEKEGFIKEALALGLSGNIDKMADVANSATPDLITHVAQDMVDDGLVAPDDMDALFKKVNPDEIVF